MPAADEDGGGGTTVVKDIKLRMWGSRCGNGLSLVRFSFAPTTRSENLALRPDHAMSPEQTPQEARTTRAAISSTNPTVPQNPSTIIDEF